MERATGVEPASDCLEGSSNTIIPRQHMSTIFEITHTLEGLLKDFCIVVTSRRRTQGSNLYVGVTHITVFKTDKYANLTALRMEGF